MKKWLSGLLALVLILTVSAGCAKEETPPPSGIYYDITGIDPRSVAYTVGDVEFPMELYLYWLAYTCSSLDYNLNMYHMYMGAYEELFDETGALMWDADFEGKPLSQHAKEETENTMRFYAAIEARAKENGLELTEEDRAAMDADFAAAVEEMGGEEAFQKNMDQMGITRESFDRIAGDAILFQHLVDLVTEEGSALYLAPEEYDQYAYTDHILLSTVDQETNEALSEEEIAAQYAKAQDFLSQLQNADDPEALFDQLAEEHSEDPGRFADKGYLVTPESNFVEEFLNAALALKPGEFSEIVESTFGYHILFRRELTLDQKNSLAQDYLYDLLDADAAGFSVQGAEQAEAIDAGEFYVSYNEKMQELNDANTADGGTESGGSDTGSDTGDGADAPADGGAEGAGE